MFIGHPPIVPAAARLHRQDIEQLGFVMNLTRLWAWRPETYEAFVALRNTVMEASTLTAREFAVLVCATAGSLGDSYCALAWGRKLADKSDASVAQAVLRELPCEALSRREEALADWARQVVRDPNRTTPGQVDALRAVGLDDREIFDATLFTSLRLAFSTVNDALGVPPDWQVAEAAPVEVSEAVRFGRLPDQRVA